jgi:hypothetical protein
MSNRHVLTPCPVPQDAGIIDVMHRPTIGLIAVVLLAVGFFLREQPDATISAACLRIGLIMSLLWYAHPQVKDVPRWLVALGVAGLFVVMRWPKLLVFAVPIAALLWFLRPKKRCQEPFSARRRGD